MGKYVYNFNEGRKEMKSVLGSKGANLSEMTKIGLNVPPGFTISTDACNQYYKENLELWPSLQEEIKKQIKILEEKTNKGLGSYDNPLLVSVRSGAVTSMPGMMDTILNLGLNEETVKGLAYKTKNFRFAYDSYRRFIEMFAEIVNGIPKYKFNRELEKYKEEKDYDSDLKLTEEDLLEIITIYKNIYFEEIKSKFPEDPYEQLLLAVKAVFNSWNNERAKIYRKIHNIPHTLGTGVTVQTMVFGNMGDNSGTGVVFTRNPATGENKLYGEFLINAQGEDVVAGIRTPQAIDRLKDDMPSAYEQLMVVTKRLESHYRDMQDIEFTIEEGKLYILQTRRGKRTAKSAIKVAVDLVNEQKITKEEAILRIDANQLNQLLHPNFDETVLKNAEVVAKGLPASPGGASGKVIFSPEDIIKAKGKEKLILVRVETSPEDIEGMIYSAGILTSRGGMTSHAAVVARGMGICCVSGCSQIVIDEVNKQFKVGDLIINEGEYISLDGSTGNIYLGCLPCNEITTSTDFEEFMNWVDEYRKLKVRCNADTPNDVKLALKYGAEGIGLCRTEHMFFDEKRIAAVRKMILSKTTDERRFALDMLLPMQRNDFIEIFSLMEDRPCTIRLLDPPLHEFLPKQQAEIIFMADELKISVEEVTNRVNDLMEVNPMLGHRGCRLGITYPEIYEMQVEAIIEAAIELHKKDIKVNPEIMIPLIGDLKELKHIKDDLIRVIDKVFLEKNKTIPYLIGTMIEVPRAALLADELAKEAEFFSFGTNDLTQMTYGFSRDDANKFLKDYENKELITKDPFLVLDKDGVGKLIKMAIKLGRQENKNLKVGICGEHGGEASSLEFFSNIGLDYVSCSPYRVPIARLISAQTELKNKNK